MPAIFHGHGPLPQKPVTGRHYLEPLNQHCCEFSYGRTGRRSVREAVRTWSTGHGSWYEPGVKRPTVGAGHAREW